jgi:hypothetical protein
MKVMQYLATLMEHEGIQRLLNENEQQILEASQILGQFPQTVKDYIYENLSDFIGSDVQETYNNIVTFTEAAVVQHVDGLTDIMAG